MSEQTATPHLATLIAEMKGRDVLALVGGVLDEVAREKRSFLEASVRVGGAPATTEELQKIRTIEAAVEAFATMSAFGEELQRKAKGAEVRAPEWLSNIIIAIKAVLAAVEP